MTETIMNICRKCREAGKYSFLIADRKQKNKPQVVSCLVHGIVKYPEDAKKIIWLDR